KRSKTKKASVAKVKRQKVKQYESHYLALILVGFLLLEGLLGTMTTIKDWQQGVTVLDISSQVTQTISDANVAIQPVFEAIEGVDQFYSMATTEMTTLLDFSGENNFAELEQVTDGVFAFYDQASIEMAHVLDLSDINTWPARVAGVSIFAQQ